MIGLIGLPGGHTGDRETASPGPLQWGGVFDIVVEGGSLAGTHIKPGNISGETAGGIADDYGLLAGILDGENGDGKG